LLKELQIPSLIYFIGFLCLSLFNATPLKAQWNADSVVSKLYVRVGVASYYASRLHGRRTTSGDKYHKYKFTAAHRTLPFGTKVKVTNLRNHKWVIVRINDRGPFNRKRIIDLSFKTATHLGITNGKGLARVRVEELPPEKKQEVPADK